MKTRRYYILSQIAVHVIAALVLGLCQIALYVSTKNQLVLFSFGFTTMLITISLWQKSTLKSYYQYLRRRENKLRFESKIKDLQKRIGEYQQGSGHNY